MHYFIPLYLVFCYLFCVNSINNVAFHDLGVKYGQRTKIVQKRLKIVISHQDWKITFLESLMNLKHERSNYEIVMIWG